jgi:hypothetical protein
MDLTLSAGPHEVEIVFAGSQSSIIGGTLQVYNELGDAVSLPIRPF